MRPASAVAGRKQRSSAVIATTSPAIRELFAARLEEVDHQLGDHCRLPLSGRSAIHVPTAKTTTRARPPSPSALLIRTLPPWPGSYRSARKMPSQRAVKPSTVWRSRPSASGLVSCEREPFRQPRARRASPRCTARRSQPRDNVQPSAGRRFRRLPFRP